MKSSSFRRFRRRSPAHEAVNDNKENKQEQSFFGETVTEPFFKSVNNVTSAETVNRKCADCEEKEVQRAPDKKEEEQEEIMKMEEKKEEEKLHRAPEEKKDEKLLKKQDKKEEETIQKKDSAIASGHTSGGTSNYINSINGKGQNMDVGLQNFFGSRMDSDFSQVKIHTGKEAADSAKAINAVAFAYNNHIVFNDEKYRPESREGKHLLAHELTHVMQQTGGLQRKANEENRYSKSPSALEAIFEEGEDLAPVFTSGIGTGFENNIAYANCAGITVRASTVANYDHGTYSASSTSVKRTKNCSECECDECLIIKGKITSVFQSNPQVSLPDVPSNLSDCEHNAVQTFIGGTLSQHEQQHVVAFNLYNGTKMTPFSYTGCREGFDAYIQTIHDNIENARVTSANAISDALDPFSPVIPCNCPDSTPPGVASDIK